MLLLLFMTEKSQNAYFHSVKAVLIPQSLLSRAKYTFGENNVLSIEKSTIVVKSNGKNPRNSTFRSLICNIHVINIKMLVKCIAEDAEF